MVAFVIHRDFRVSTHSSETWAYVAGTWIQYGPATLPPPRHDPAMALDEARSSATMFGGSSKSFSGNLSDTWDWDGNGWRQVAAGSAPGQRSGSTMSYDTIRRRLVLFGGHGTSGTLGDTWELANPNLGDFSTFVLPLWNLGGIAPLTLAIPSDHGLVGVRFFTQGWAADPMANQLGIVVSNGGQALLGHP